jgi:hypothetical protein
MSEKRRVSCPIKHVNFYIVTHDDESHKVKCVNIKICGDSCPYIKNPVFKTEYQRAPEYKAK